MCNLGEFDVIVCGGGPAGTMAAVAAAQEGAKVALFEESGMLGGMASTGLPLLSFHNAAGRQIVTGLPQSFINQLQAAEGTVGHLVRPRRHFGMTITPVDAEKVRFELQKFVCSSGVELFLHASCWDVLFENEKISGITVYGENRVSNVYGQVIVDATGDADIVRQSKAGRVNQFHSGRQPMSLMFQMGGVDLDDVAEEMNEELILGVKLGERKESVVCIQGNFGNWDEEVERDRLFPDRKHAIWFTSVRRGLVDINCTRLYGMDPLHVSGRTQAIVKGRNDIERISRFLQQHLRSFQNSYVTQVSPLLGVRDSFHIEADYLLTSKDVFEGNIYDDNIAFGGYAIDYHDPKGSGITLDPVNTSGYGIPFRTMLPSSIEGVIVAGRTIGSEPIPFASSRVMAQCMAIGEAAGCAAAMSVNTGQTPRQLDGSLIRTELARRGASV